MFLATDFSLCKTIQATISLNIQYERLGKTDNSHNGMIVYKIYNKNTNLFQEPFLIENGNAVENKQRRLEQAVERQSHTMPPIEPWETDWTLEFIENYKKWLKSIEKEM